AIAAHEEARRLDPNVPTSLQQTLLTKGDFDGVLAPQGTLVTGGGDEGIQIIALGLSGRREEAMAAVRRRGRVPIPAFDAWTGYLEAWLEGRPPDMAAMMGRLAGLTIMGDPEAIFQEGWMLCDVGEHQRGLEFLKRAVARGYFVAPTLSGSRQFDALRDNPAFQAVLADAEAGRARALAAFREAGGERLL